MSRGNESDLEDVINKFLQLYCLTARVLTKPGEPLSLRCCGQAGTGMFQVVVLLTCGLANAADAVEILSVGLLSTAAKDELRLTDKRAGNQADK
eukprot:gene25298-10952_t